MSEPKKNQDNSTIVKLVESSVSKESQDIINSEDYSGERNLEYVDTAALAPEIPKSNDSVSAVFEGQSYIPSKKLEAYTKRILFQSNKATFQRQTYPVLQSIVAIMKEYPDSNFSIEGNTDSDGSDATNQKLSQDRAAAVRNYLIEMGIDSERLSSVGYGESKPIDSNLTEEGKANNRRIEIKLVN